jgi:hypothetical protein
MSTKKKIGRNDPCHCGSGKKYKKCHYLMGSDPEPRFTHEDAQQFQLMEAKEHQRKQQQGLGKGIISADFKGHKFVAVGNELHYSPNWKTFPDFLDSHIKNALDVDWGKAEFAKDHKDMHPIIQWYDIWVRTRLKGSTAVEGVFSTQHTGASMSYFVLAHSLYLIRHNAGVQTELIRRLKLADRSNFHGALYEISVASYFIKAGYDLEFENELDGEKTHCEFTATHKVTKRQFSVEAKTIAFNTKSGKPNVISKLNDALGKEADHERIVFIDIGKPSETHSASEKWMIGARERLNELETLPLLKGENLPPAYVIFTNHPFWNALEGTEFPFAAMAEGFKIPSYKTGYKDTVKNALIEREKHKEVSDLLESIETHGEIPSTFDGENPEIIFGEDDGNPRLIIGNKYNIPCEGGTEIGILTQVTVMEAKKQAIGMYDFEGKGVGMAICSLSDSELAAYKKHPDTFFGKVDPQKQIKNPLEFYDHMYHCYKNATRENLLKFMKDRPDYDVLTSLPQEELAKLYCEGITEVVMSSHSNNE